MISSNLVVEGVPGSHHYHHALVGTGSHPIHSFSTIHHLNPSTVTSGAHLMSATSFTETPYLKAANGSLLQTPPEFLRPLPKPAPIVATRYNGVTTSLNGSIKPRLSNKYLESESQGPVNLVHQLKETSVSDTHSNYKLYPSPRLYPHGPSSYPHFPPPPPMQSGPYGSLYPSSPYTPILHHDNRSTHLLQLQQYPDSNTPILKSPPSATTTTINSVKNVFEAPTVPVVTSEANNRGEKRPFKVPSGKEGSLKHRILTRPEARVQKKVVSSRNSNVSLPPSVPSASSQSNGISISPTEASSPTTTTSSNSSTSSTSSSSSSSSSSSCSNSRNTVNCATTNNTGAILHNFSKGSLIQLANGDLKKVEDMQTVDFLSSAEKSTTMRIDPSTVVRINESPSKKGIATLTLSYGEQRHQVEYETAVEHPYFVFNHGWSSCAPDRTLQKYGLQCRQLQVGDVCASLSPKLNPSSGSTNPTPKTTPQKLDLTSLKMQHQNPPAQSLQNGHLSNNIDAKVFVYKNIDLRLNSKDNNGLHFSNTNRDSNVDGNICNSSYSSINGSNFSINLINRQSDAKKCEKLENDDNNNSNNTSDKYDGLICRKKRRWSAPDQISDEYQNSPLSSPQSSSSVLSLGSSIS